MSILELNKTVADTVFGPSGAPASACQQDADRRRAAGLSPFICAGAAYFVLGGLVDKGKDAWSRRKAAGGIAAMLFLAI